MLPSSLKNLVGAWHRGRRIERRPSGTHSPKIVLEDGYNQATPSDLQFDVQIKAIQHEPTTGDRHGIPTAGPDWHESL